MQLTGIFAYILAFHAENDKDLFLQKMTEGLDKNRGG